MNKKGQIGTHIIGLLLAVLTISVTNIKAVENGQIAFTAGDDIFTMNPDGNGTDRLGYVGRKPKYSPDGKFIAYFVGDQIWAKKLSIFFTPVFVTSAGPLTGFRKVELSWSPDSGRIAFTCNVGICAVNLDGTNRTVISSDTRDDAPEWSPDGMKFLFLKRPFFACNHECQPDIFVMNVDGTNHVRLTTRGGFTILTGHVWSPDGTKIAYAYNFLGLVMGLTVMDADGSDPRTLIEGDDTAGIRSTDPAWSPDGTKIAFAGDPVPSFDTFVPDIFTIDLNGTNLRNLTRTLDIGERDPDWGTSPIAPFVKTPFDFDGDGRADISVFRPSDAVWYLNRSIHGSFATQFGFPADKIVPADYDGDGRADVAIYRPSGGLWYIANSSDGTFSFYRFGLADDLPVPADYDGDGKADVSVFRPSTGTWYRLNISTGAFIVVQFGLNGDKPTAGDFDGDGKADIAVYRPSTGIWYQIRSSNGSFYAEHFGVSTDKAVPADYDGDGKTDIAVYRESPTGSSLWFVRYSLSGTYFAHSFGTAGDIPVPGNYDTTLSYREDFAVFRPSNSTWYIRNDSLGTFTTQQWGLSGDLPTPAAFHY